MEMFILSLGECCCTYEVVAPGVDDGRRIHIPVSGYLLRRGDELVLVDTGMNRVHIDDPDATWRGTPAADHLTPSMRREDSLLFRLAELGIAPQDIDYVVNTHLHFDHAGNNDLLSNATFFVQRDHYDYAKAHNASFPGQYWDLPALRYELLDGQSEIFAGVTAIPTPGHVPGHQSILLQLPKTGAVVLCGDAVYCEENFEFDSWTSQADPDTARASAHALRDLAVSENARMIYGHDKEQARTLRYSTASYE